MQRHMKPSLHFLILAIHALLATTSPAASVGAPVAAAGPERRTLVVASYDAEPAIAVALRSWEYPDSVDASTFCSDHEQPIGQRPECLAVEEYLARRDGNFDGRALLYLPGYCRDRSLERLRVSREEMHELLRNFPNVRLKRGWRWGEYVFTQLVVYSDDRQQRHTSIRVARYDRNTQRYWLTEEVSPLNYIIWSVPPSDDLAHVDVLDAVPPGMRPLRVMVDMNSPRESRSIIVEDAPARAEAAAHDLVVHLREEPLPFAAGAFLEADRALLDDPAQNLRDAIAASIDHNQPIAERLRHWIPDAREHVAVSFEQGAGPMALLGIDRSDVDSLRIVSRLRFTDRDPLTGEATDDFIVWYGWVYTNNDPRLRPADDPKNRVRPVSILMRRDAQSYVLDSTVGGGFALQIARDPWIVAQLAMPRFDTNP